MADTQMWVLIPIQFHKPESLCKMILISLSDYDNKIDFDKFPGPVSYTGKGLKGFYTAFFVCVDKA